MPWCSIITFPFYLYNNVFCYKVCINVNVSACHVSFPLCIHCFLCPPCKYVPNIIDKSSSHFFLCLKVVSRTDNDVGTKVTCNYSFQFTMEIPECVKGSFITIMITKASVLSLASIVVPSKLFVALLFLLV